MSKYILWTCCGEGVGICWPVAFGFLYLAEIVAMSRDIKKLDENMAVKRSKDGLLWRDVRDWGVEGRAWEDTARYYCRLPGRAKEGVTEAVWELAQHTAGMCARFETDATAISARWTLLSESLAMPHSPASGVSGLDLYVLDEQEQWRWIGAGVAEKGKRMEVQLVGELDKGRRKYMLYLPLYNGVESLEIGVEAGAEFSAVQPRCEGAMLFWGTSITQGGCASRAGMAYPAILGRRFDRPVINLGFSGNGKMDPEVTELVAELDPAVFVIDCVGNMSVELLAERTVPLVRRLRQARSATPIVLVGSATRATAAFVAEARRYELDKLRSLRNAYEELVAEGVGGLHFVQGDDLLKGDEEGTVDGVHPTDLGFAQMADALEPVLRRVLGGR